MMKLFLKLLCAASFLPFTMMAQQPGNEKWEECARLAQTGDAEAQYRMGKMYKDGTNVGKNLEDAFYWFKKSASNGNGNALLEVALCFRDGRGVLADNRIAAENFWRAAERGNMEGAYNYALMLRDGIGVSQDKEKAYYWFSKAAEAGYSDSAVQAEKLRQYARSAKGRRVKGGAK